MFVRRDLMGASNIMQKRVMNKPNIEIYWNTEVEEILGRQEVEGVRVVNNRTQVKTEIPIKGFFVGIGHRPNTAMFAPYLRLDANGYIQTIPGTTKTNVSGVFAAGDVQDAIYRQAVTAAGTGCMAALEAEQFLASQEDKA